MKRSIIYILIVSSLMASCATLNPPKEIPEAPVPLTVLKDTAYISVQFRPDGNRISMQATSTRPIPERLRIVAQVHFHLISASGTTTPAVCPIGVTIDSGKNKGTALSAEILYEHTTFYITESYVSLSTKTSANDAIEYALRQNNNHE